MMKNTGNSLTVRLPDSHCSSFNDNWMGWTTIFVPMPVLIMLSVCCMFVGRLFIRKWREWRRTGETEKTSTSTTRGSFLNVYTQSIINWLSGSYSRKSILVLEVINQDFCWKFLISQILTLLKHSCHLLCYMCHYPSHTSLLNGQYQPNKEIQFH
mgnify:CR=1 FL=1